jgi:hypothetical protein
MLPAPFRQEPVVTTSDEFGSIGQGDAVTGFDRDPAVKYLSGSQTTVVSSANRSDDLVTDLNLRQWLAGSISHQDDRRPV